MQIFNRTICCTFADFEGICSTHALQCRIRTGTVTCVVISNFVPANFRKVKPSVFRKVKPTTGNLQKK